MKENLLNLIANIKQSYSKGSDLNEIKTAMKETDIHKLRVPVTFANKVQAIGGTSASCTNKIKDK